MKLFYKIVVTIAFLALSTSAVRAQGDLGELIKSGPGDATRLANAYLSPLFKGLGIGLNTGWYNSARPKGVGHFEIRVSATASFVPASGQTFDVTKLGLTSVALKSGSTPNAPTLFGSDDQPTPILQTKDQNGTVVEEFSLPDGIGMNIAPAPQIQATIGLPKGIDATLRIVPKINIGDEFGSVNMIGGGLKFNVLPLISKVSTFNLAVALGYTQLKYTFPLEVRPTSGSIPKDASQNQDFSNQRVDAKFSGVTGEVILSKKLLFFTPFVSAAYMTSKTDVGLVGNYPIVTGANVSGTPSAPVIVRTYTSFPNPISIKQTDISGLRATAGFSLNLAIFKLYASGSLGEYNSVNAGIGLGI